MNSLYKFSLFVVVLTATTVCFAAGQGSFKSFNIQVTSTIWDRDPDNNLLLTESDGSYPDGPGYGAGSATYTTTGSSPAKPTTSSYVYSSGGWYLYLGNQQARTIWLTLASQGVRDSNNNPIPDYYYSSSVEAYSRCFNGTTEIPFTSILNSYTNCSFGVDFSSEGIGYKLVMTPNLPAPGPATGTATVTCTSNTSPCTSWTIVPNGTAANLYQVTRRGLVYLGQYQNTYNISIE
jgi:hypothetical protein